MFDSSRFNHPEKLQQRVGRRLEHNSIKVAQLIDADVIVSQATEAEMQSSS